MSAALPPAPSCGDDCSPAATTLIPGPAGAAGAAGAAGTNGQNAYTALTAQFTMPALSGSATATMTSNAWIAYGQVVAIGDPGAGTPYAYLRAGAKTGSTQVSLTNLETAGGAYSDNVAPGTVFPIGTIVSPGGLQGQAGADGASGAPDTAPYVVTTNTPALAMSSNLGALTTGLLKITVAAGVATPSTASSGADYTAYDADLAAIAGLTSAADRLPYYTGAGTAALATFTAFGRSLVDDANASTARGTLSAAGSGANTDITSLAGLTTPLSIAQGGTSGATAAAARAALDLAHAHRGIVILKNIQPSGTHAGTFTTGAWRVRVLNTEEYDDKNVCTLAANQFTLLAGEYYIQAFAPAYKVNKHQLRLYNVTDASVVGYGTNAYSGAADNAMTASLLFVHVDIVASKTFRLEHYCETTQATDGFGQANSFGGSEIYANVVIMGETE